MLAAVLRDFSQLALEDVPIPVPAPRGRGAYPELRVLCHGLQGHQGIRRNVKFPFIPGHEPAGIVARVGSGVTPFKEGDEVICQPSGFCGLCPHCKAGNTHYCVHSFTTGGDGPEDVWPGAFASTCEPRPRAYSASRPESLSTRRP